MCDTAVLVEEGVQAWWVRGESRVQSWIVVGEGGCICKEKASCRTSEGGEKIRYRCFPERKWTAGVGGTQNKGIGGIKGLGDYTFIFLLFNWPIEKKIGRIGRISAELNNKIAQIVPSIPTQCSK